MLLPDAAGLDNAGMRHFDFPSDVLAEVERDRFEHPDPRVQRRMEAPWLKAHGERHGRIAELACLSRATVQRVLDRYESGGVAAVRSAFASRPEGSGGALAGHRETLEATFRDRPPRTVAEAGDRIERLTGVRRGPTQVRRFLRERLGLRWRKVAAVPVPPKLTLPEHAAGQADFLKAELGPRLAEAQAGRRAVYFVDAAHFVLGSFLGWVWCATRVFVRAASGRQRYNVLAAFDAVTHDLVRVTNTTYVTAETVCQLLREVAGLGLATPVTLVLDNARYQRCKLVQDLALALGIELLFLPSYSPNLNLIERLWKFVRKQALNSRHHPSFADFRAAIDGCLDGLPTIHKAQVHSLMTLKFQTFENVSLLAA